MIASLGVVMDPINTISAMKDTTLLLLLAAQKRGWGLLYMEQSDLFLDQGIAKAQVAPLKVFDDCNHWYELGTTSTIPLGDLSAILMRKDPPFNQEYIYSTYLLEAAQRQGTLVVNNPQSLRDCNEKVFTTQFPQCCPPLMVSRNMTQLRTFYHKHQDVIFKPLEGMGGSRVFRCSPQETNLTVILETLTENSTKYIMAQRFIPEITQGDKRILVVDGQAIPYALARIPAEGETRGNLAAGGRGLAQPLTPRDEWIVSQVAPTLVEKGLLFVGLDVIGDYLTEINVTSPTCAREIDQAYNTNIGEHLMSAIERRLNREGAN